MAREVVTVAIIVDTDEEMDIDGIMQDVVENSNGAIVGYDVLDSREIEDEED